MDFLERFPGTSMLLRGLRVFRRNGVAGGVFLFFSLFSLDFSKLEINGNNVEHSKYVQ